MWNAQLASKTAFTRIISGYLGRVGDGARRTRRFDGPDFGAIVEAGTRHLEKDKMRKAVEIHST